MSVNDQILDVLKKNARTSHADIALLLGVSEQDVSERIRDMEQSGILLGYTCVVDESKRLKASVRALIEIKINPEKDRGFDQIAGVISQFPNVLDHFLISGSYDFLLIVEGTDLHDISTFVFDHLATIEHVVSTQTHFIMKKFKDRGILFPSDSTPPILSVAP